MRIFTVVTLAALAASCNSKSLLTGRCHANPDCPNGYRCTGADTGGDPAPHWCVQIEDGGSDSMSGHDGPTDGPADAHVDVFVDHGFQCEAGTACSDGGVCSSANNNTCVECNGNADCDSTSPKPICETSGASTHTCRGCTSDSECTSGPKICLDSGRCAADTEVIYVDGSAAGCATGSGHSGSPVCTFALAVPMLGSTRNIIILLGVANDRLALNTPNYAPVVIGRKNMAGDLGTIPAGGSTALTVSSDNVLVRDMIINAGAGSNAKGIVVSRSATKLALRRVSVTLGTGLGIQADTSATLAMDQCYVQDNSAGGLLINSAGFTVQNTVFASNGYGVQFSTTASPQVFSFNTVVESVAAVCNLTSPQTLSDSIVVGSALNCSLANSLTTAPSFSSSSPYHLTTHVPCKSTPASTAMVPDHDIDGDMRPSSGTDCGADQYVGP